MKISVFKSSRKATIAILYFFLTATASFSQTNTFNLRSNFFGAPDLSTEITFGGVGFGNNPSYRIYAATNVTGNGEQIRLGQRKYVNGILDGIWVAPGTLQIGQPAIFNFFFRTSLPSVTLSRYTEFPEAGYTYLYKIEANGNQNSRGILMEFDRKPAYQINYFGTDNLPDVGINTPINGVVQLSSDRPTTQYFLIRYRHTNDPVNQYQWTQVSFPVTNGRLGYFSIPAYLFTGSVEMKIFSKDRPLSAFNSTTINDNIYDVPYVSETITAQVVSNTSNQINSEFTVNMTGQTVSPEGVFLNIRSSNSLTRLLKMTNTGNNIYKVTAKVISGEEQEYVFQNGIITENVPVACRGQNTSIRKFTPTIAQPNPLAVCFNACNTSCAGNASTVNVTFRVNTTGTTVGPAGVKLAGSFNNFSTTTTPMTLVGNNMYQVTIPLTIGEVVTYKYVNGNTFEAVPFGCALTDAGGNANRYLSVPASNTTLNPVCFNLCDNSCAATSPSTVNVTFRVNMSGQTINPGGVKLAGTFNGFSTTTNPMTSVGNNIYETTLSLNAGTNFQYKFVNGSVFELISSECGIDDGGGNINRVLQTGSNNTTLNTVCFGSCDNSCANTPPVNVTFRVNMTGQTVSPSGIKLSGSFNNFSTTATPMTPVGNNVYQGTVPLVPNDIVQYKFVNGSNFELINTECGMNDGNGNINRFLTVPALATTLNTVCFSLCNNGCATSPATTAVKFRVNMTGQNVSINGVKLAGSFNGFSTTANPMMNMGGNVYEATVDLPFNTTFSYKFVNGSNFELVPAQCGLNDGNGNINRIVSTANLSNQLVPAVCFGSCSDCNRSQITFRVDMGNVAVSPSGVFLAGNFNEFSTTANPMTPAGNNIFITTIPLTPATQVTYKFVNGSNFELITSECGIMGGATVYDRLLNVPSENTVLGLVCFNSCNTCVNTSIIEPIVISGGLYPNPASNTLFFKKPPKGNYSISDVNGRVVASGFSAGFISSIDISALQPGMYFIRIMDKKEMQVMKFIKQ